MSIKLLLLSMVVLCFKKMFNDLFLIWSDTEY